MSFVYSNNVIEDDYEKDIYQITDLVPEDKTGDVDYYSHNVKTNHYKKFDDNYAKNRDDLDQVNTDCQIDDCRR